MTVPPMQPLFITGIGTDVGKTVAAAIVTEALNACYWKPVQAGFDQGTDSEWVAARISSPEGRILPEAYRLTMPASPHIAARRENITIDLDLIVDKYREYLAAVPLKDAAPSKTAAPHLRSSGERVAQTAWTVVEGAGGLYVPLNDQSFVIDLAAALNAPVILVSRNYLGSINHSVMTGLQCKARNIPVIGWLFNDQYLDYEEEIVRWTGIPAIGSIPRSPDPNSGFIREQAAGIRDSLLRHLRPFGVTSPIQ